MNSWQIFRPYASRICCSRSFSTRLPSRQNGRATNSASALLEQLAPRPNRPGPRSSQASHSPVESRNSSPTQPSTASATDSTAQSDPLSGSYSPIFTSSPRSAGPPPQNPPSNTASSNSATKAPSSDMQLAHHIAQSYSVHQRAEKSFALGQSAEKLQDKTTQDELAQQSHRRWRRGDVYAPRDLGVVEMKKWRVKSVTPKRDVFDELGIDPRKEYKNFALLGEFMTETGRIKHSSVTGLRPRNQRRIAKAIRRAIGIGIMPSVHKHPELLNKERNR